jgi:hypothetical protein
MYNRAPTTLKSEEEVTSLSGAEKREEFKCTCILNFTGHLSCSRRKTVFNRLNHIYTGVD